MTVSGSGMDRTTRMTRTAFLGKGARVAGAVALGGGALGGVLGEAMPARAAVRRLGRKVSTVTFQESWLSNVEFAGVYVAVKKGYYTDAGIDLKISPGGVTVDPRSSVANGASLIGSVAEGTDVVLAISQGADIQAFGAQYQQNPGCLMVHADKGINSVKDLKGKTIGIQNAARQQIQAILQHNGLSGSDVKIQIVGNDPTVFAVGRVDAFTAFAFNEPIALGLKGIKTKCFSFSEIGLPAYGDVFVAKKSTIAKETSLLEAFLSATRRGWAYAIAHPTEAIQITLKDFAKDQDAKQQTAQMKVEVPMLTSKTTKQHGLLWMDKSTWHSSIQFMDHAKLLKKPVSVGTVMTDSILARAR